MIPQAREGQMASGGVEESAVFGISMVDEVHIMGILRDTLYTDKILAVLREYASNAWDAHRMVGKDTVPISVTLPTNSLPKLSIRDYGPGLSRQEVLKVYTQYGASTKRDSDTAVGMLGIGSKSGFAYSDSFTVISWHGGIKSVYVAVLDATDRGVINLLHEEPCAEDETGVLIQIDVEPSDIWEFQNTAEKLFHYFNPQPLINHEIPKPLEPLATLPSGSLYKASYGKEWTAVMGCVPYRINVGKLNRASPLPTGVYGVLTLGIGDVQISASREELKYSDSTRKTINEKIDSLIDEFVTDSLRKIESGEGTQWEKRLRIRELVDLGLGSLVGNADRLDSVGLGDPPAGMWFSRTFSQEVARTLRVSDRNAIYIKDSDRAMKGYSLEPDGAVVHKDKALEWDALLPLLDAFLSEKKILGVPVHKLSGLNWDEYRYAKGGSRVKGERTKQHSQKYKIFELINPALQHNVKSRCWKPVEDHVPSESDVYVVIRKFSPYAGFQDDYTSHSAVLKCILREMPKVYGYKSTSSSPVVEDDIVGTHFKIWKEESFKGLVVEFQSLLEKEKWASLTPYGHRDHGFLKAAVSLGKDHPVFQAVKKMFGGSSASWRRTRNTEGKAPSGKALLRFYEDRRELFPEIELPCEKAIESLVKTYPLLCDGREGLQNLTALWGRQASMWVDYVRMVDDYSKLKGEVK